MKKYALVSLLIGCLICCKSKEEAATAAKPATGSIEGNWELRSIADTLPFESLYPDAKPTISFEFTENKVSGKNSCNNYSGRFSLDGVTLDIDEKTMIATKMFCGGTGEKTFMDALGRVTAYSVTDYGKTLNLLSGDNILLRFIKK